jgi:hypothetical protein
MPKSVSFTAEAATIQESANNADGQDQSQQQQQENKTDNDAADAATARLPGQPLFMADS